jgi:hypothetical protein
MNEKWNALFETVKSTGANLKDMVAEKGQAAMDSTIEAIEKWLEEFPKIESYGLSISSFSFIMRLSPSLEVELRGNHEDFPIERLDQIIKENKATSLSNMVFTSIRTAYRLHAKIAKQPEDLLLVKIRLSLSPEISVFIGKLRVS